MRVGERFEELASGCRLVELPRKGLDVGGRQATRTHVRRAELQGDVDDHVLLAADDLAPPELEEDLAGVDAEPLRGPLGVEQERAVDAGIAEGQCRPIDDLLPGHDRARRRPRRRRRWPACRRRSRSPSLLGDRDQDLGGAVAGAGAQAAGAAVDLVDAFLERADRVRDRERQVVVGVDRRPASRRRRPAFSSATRARASWVVIAPAESTT